MAPGARVNAVCCGRCYGRCCVGCCDKRCDFGTLTRTLILSQSSSCTFAAAESFMARCSSSDFLSFSHILAFLSRFRSNSWTRPSSLSRCPTTRYMHLHPSIHTTCSISTPPTSYCNSSGDPHTDHPQVGHSAADSVSPLTAFGAIILEYLKVLAIALFYHPAFSKRTSTS